MRKTFAALFLMLWLAAPLAAAEPVRHVVLVSVDGLAASYLEDPRADLPMLRELARRGAAARGMITSFPSVTWPSHVSLATGTRPARHGVIGNSVYDRQRQRTLAYIGDPELTRHEAVKVPMLYEAAHQANLRTAAIIWPCSSGAEALEFMIPDSNKPELHARYTTPALFSLMAEAGIDIKPLGGWGWDKARSSERDLLYTQVTCRLLQDQRVNLVLLHLIKPDGVEHAFGPHTPEAYDAVTEADRHIRTLWEVLNAPPLAGSSALFVVSDHGFAPYEKFIQPNVALKQLGLIDVDDQGKVTARRAWCVAQGGSAFIYLLDESQRARQLQSVRDAMSRIEGVTHVIERNGFADLGLPDSDDNPQTPDLVLATGPGYSFSDSLDGDVVKSAGGLKGSHGHLPAPDYMHALFVAAGTGIKPQVRFDTMQNIDVAPTIARLMGFDFPSADGRVLTEMLAE